MKKIFLILPFLLIGAVHAASMCVPGTASDQSYSAIPSKQESNNRGYFAVGTSCVSGTTMCKSTLVRGESHCSTVAILPSSKFETCANYCWCRLTHIRAPNGYLAPWDGDWVFSQIYTYGGNNYCASYCASGCASGFLSKPPFRRALFVIKQEAQ